MAVAYLEKMNIDYKLDMIGTGPILNQTIQLSKDLGLNNRVSFLSSMPNEMVMKKMLEADVFLFTSNREEGWGVVLNEAMNSGCAVIANREIGAVPFLIKNNINGLIYDQKNIQNLYTNLLNVCLDHALRKKLQFEAYKTIKDEWNPYIAVKRLILQINNLLANKPLAFFNDGPLSNVY